MTDNELIAEFMGINVRYWGPVLYRADEDGFIDFTDDPQTFHPDLSWSDLMPVVEKIERLGNRCEIGITKCKIYSADYNRETFYGATKIQAVYDHVVDYIKWYNQNKKP